MKKRALLVIPVLMALFCFPVNAAVSPNAVTTVDAPLRQYDDKIDVRGQAIQYQAYKTDQMVVQQGVQNNGTTINFLYSEYDLWDTTIHCSYTLTNTSADVVTFDSGSLYSNLYVMMSDVNVGTNSAVSYQGYYIDNVTNGAVLVSTSNGVNVFRMDNIRSGDQIVILPYQSVSFSYDFHAIWYGVDDGTTSNPNTGVDIQNYTNTVSYSSGGVSSIDFETFISYQESYEAYFAYHVDQIWTALQTLVSQGVVDQSKYDSIITILSNSYNTVYHTTGGVGYYWQYGSWASSSDNNVVGNYYVTSPGSIVVDYDYNTSALNQNNYNYDAIYDIPVYISLSLENISNSVYTFPSVGYLQIPVTLSPTLNGSTFIGYEFEVVNNTGLILSRLQAQNIILGTTLLDNGKNMIEGNTRYNIVICKHNYYGVVGDNVNTNKPTINSSSITYSVPSIVLVKGSYDGSNTPWSLWSIREKIQQFIDAYNANQQGADDLNDSGETIQDQSDTQHTQEQSYFDDNSTALDNAGLQNFEFDTNQVQAIGTSAQMFTNVWNMLGPWSAFIIFILTLRLATFILRHKPKSGE